MKFLNVAILLLGINSVLAAGILDTLSLESVLHAPPGIFSKTSSGDPMGDLFGGITGAAGLTGQLQSITSNPDAMKELYNNFKKVFNKDTPATEDNKRIGLFENKLFGVLDHNIKAISGQESYEKGINQFSDMTPQEVRSQFTGYKPDNSTAGTRKKREGSPMLIPMQNTNRQKRDIPDSLDWRTYGFVSPVKNQKNCGSCTLFASSGLLESAWIKSKGGKILDLSEQELLDCIPLGGGHGGCDGNDYESTLAYQKSHGQGEDSSYVYASRVGRCKRKGVVAKISDFHQVNQDEGDLKDKIANFGPVAVAIHVADDLMDYHNGVWDKDCRGDIDHAVLTVGYGNEGGKDYWLIKNSWATSWGDKGYFKIRRNYRNLCQIATDAFYITV